MITLACLSASAIEQDNEGYYLIGSLDDWKAFAQIVNSSTNTAANAKMTADVNLGDDQTHIGSMTQNQAPFYGGIFDGQGHTLTVAYVGDGNQIMGVFAQTRNATIKNLHVAGSIHSLFAFVGVVGCSNAGTDVISNVWNSADITVQFSGWNWTGGIAGGVDAGGKLSIVDSLFTGTISAAGSYNGCFLGYFYRGSATISNCLSTGTISSGAFSGSHTNCYVKQFPAAIPAAMQCTDATLADGTIATALQAGREEEVWAQDAALGIPMLKLFAQSVLKGDLNEDGRIDGSDVSALLEIVLSGGEISAKQLMAGDFTDDGRIDGSDVSALLEVVLSGE